MYLSIIYKEWIKTWKAFALIVLVFLGVGIYSFMSLSQSIRLSGAVSFWESIIQKDTYLFPYFKFLPLLAGVLLAITQYAPELQNKRLKLTLHLPLPETNIIMAMLSYGFVIMFALLSLTLIMLLLVLRTYLPVELVWTSFDAAFPWFVAGLAGYLIGAWICMEPVWKQRVFNALPGICALSFFFIGAKSGAYQTFIPYLIVFTFLSFFFSFYSAERFKEGVQ